MAPKSRLKIEAERIIEDLKLVDMLSRYGRTGIVGSVAYDLIVKLDIDIHVLVADDADLLKAVDGIYHQLLEHENVREVRISDYRKQNALKIGIDKYPAESGDWTIDIWVTSRLGETALGYVERLKEELSSQHRQAILCIKEHYHKTDQLRDGMSSLIYEAVISDGIRTIDEFELFLKHRKFPRY